jgi:hypothetical protein
MTNLSHRATARKPEPADKTKEQPLPKCDTPTRCRLRHWVQLDAGYDLEFPIEELGNAIALCGWTAAEHVKPVSRYDAEEIKIELARLQSLGALEIPDGRRWFKWFGKRIAEAVPNPNGNGGSFGPGEVYPSN